MRGSVVILFLVSILCEVRPVRILGVFPIPSRSHQVVFRSYTDALAKRGHELVIITPEPKKTDSPNVTEIDVSFSYEDMKQILENTSGGLKRGVVSDIDSVIEIDVFVKILDLFVNQFNSPAVKGFLKDTNQKFDLIVAEGFMEYHLIVSEVFKAPIILFPSFMGFPEHFEMLGAPSRHPIVYPHFNRCEYGNLGFWDMLKQLYYEVTMYNMFARVELAQDQLLKENFGPQAPTTKQLKKRVDFLFLNAYAVFSNNRPIPPNIIYLGATHLQPAKEIPKDLKAYLDSSTHGVIYVSFGSNIRPSLMAKDLLDELLKAFEALPYDVLWRFDGESLDYQPKNVKWQNWFPQRDLLFHPNIKAFVTQCGLQSTDEAIDATVPLIGIPMMAEQWYNAQKYVDLGIGVKLDALTLTAEDLLKGVMTVATNDSYKENITRLRSICHDQPQTPLEKAVWWTEYVIRHRGAKHLRSPVVDLSWSEYYMLNILLPVVGALLSVVITAFCIVSWVCRRVRKAVCCNGKKLKRS